MVLFIRSILDQNYNERDFFLYCGWGRPEDNSRGNYYVASRSGPRPIDYANHIHLYTDVTSRLPTFSLKGLEYSFDRENSIIIRGNSARQENAISIQPDTSRDSIDALVDYFGAKLVCKNDTVLDHNYPIIPQCTVDDCFPRDGRTRRRMVHEVTTSDEKDTLIREYGVIGL